MKEHEIIQHRQVAGLTIFLNTVDYRTPHVHPEWELIWILNNSMSVTCGKDQFICAPGELILFAPNEPHEFHKLTESCTFLCLQLSSEILPSTKLLSLYGRRPHLYSDYKRLNDIKESFRSAANHYFLHSPNYELYCLGKCILILNDLLDLLPYRQLSPEEAACITKRNARLNRLIKFVDNEFTHKIRLSDFAKQEDCSLGYISRFVKETTNLTFQEYVNTVRFNYACKLIAEGGKRMLDVCMDSGFSDYRYFTRTFREFVGMTPEEYSHHISLASVSSANRSIHSSEHVHPRAESTELLDKYCSISK